MVRSLIRAALLVGTVVLAASVAKAGTPSPAETEGNKMEKKGNMAERAANAEKPKGAKMEKKDKAIEEAGDNNSSSVQDAAGRKMKKKGEAIEKEGEAGGDVAEQMGKSGNADEKVGVKAQKNAAKANSNSKN